jgi:hypothetical protein
MKLARPLILGTVGIVVVVFIVTWAELVTGKIMIGFLQLPPVVLPLLFLLIVVNSLVRRAAPRAALSAPEIAVIYLMMVIASMIASRGLMEDLLPTLVAVNYFASPSNHWKELFFPHIRPWMVPWDTRGDPKQEVARAFYEGYFYGQPIPWQLWVLPILRWCVLVGAVYVAFLCLAAILRRQWTEQERLSYPLVQLPLEMIRDAGGSGSFFRNPLLWAGAALPALLFTLNGLHQLYPSVPELPVEIGLNELFPDRPWRDMSMLTIFASLAGIGFFFLLPADLLFSFWFFFLAGRLQEVLASAMGMEVQGAPHAGARHFLAYQTVGAFVTLAAYLLYISRAQWRRVARQALRGGKGDDAREMLSYRAAFFGLIGSFVVIVAWLSAAGMSPWLALFEMGIYVFVQSLIMGRAMAEGGLLMAEGSFTPLDLFGAFTPRRGLGPANLTVLAFTQAMFTRDLRGMPFTGFLDGQRLAEGVGMNLRRLAVVFAVALLVSFLVAVSLQLWLPYRKGAAVALYSFAYQSNPTQFWRENAPLMRGELEYSPDAPLWVAVGALVTVFLAVMRMRFYWWPLHPLGYAMCASWTVIVFWFPIFVAWLLKSAAIRYGGLPFYARARPFFLGLIFGEFALATIWTLISSIWNTPVPSFPWP